MSETLGRSYEALSSIYDRFIGAATGGQNLATRIAQLEDMKPGDRVLYVGSGAGEDAIAAAAKGVDVTCLDLSAGMIGKARRAFERAGRAGNFICADVMDYVPESLYDAVVANFFLNIFTRPVMEQILSRLVDLIRPGGRLMIADFAPVDGRRLQRVLHRLYYKGSNITFWAMGLCPLHPIYDYTEYYLRHGLTLESKRRFRIFFKGPWVFQTTTAVKGIVGEEKSKTTPSSDHVVPTLFVP